MTEQLTGSSVYPHPSLCEGILTSLLDLNPGLHDGFHQSHLLEASLPSERSLALRVILNGVSFL